MTEGKNSHEEDNGMPKKHHGGELVSPQTINDDPTLWLGVPHEMHKVLLELMEKMFPGFTQKLKDMHIHCLMCDGKGYIGAITKDGDVKVITGYIGEEEGERDIVVKDPEDIGVSIDTIRKSTIVPEDCATCPVRDTCSSPQKDDMPFLKAS